MDQINDKLEYFINRTDERLQRIEDKVDHLEKWKLKVVGGAAALSALITFLVEIFRH